MGLETGTLITDFNAAWPLGTDDVSQGDDHLRLIKSILQNALPGNTDIFTFTGTDLHIVDADIFARDMEIESITVHAAIFACAQVAIGLGAFDGTTATLKGNYFGIVGMTRTPGQAVGSYDITLVESPGADVSAGGSGLHTTAGGYLVSVVPGPTANSITVTVRNTGANNAPLADITTVNFFVLDSGRD